MTASITPPVFSLHEDSLPLLISIPHVGTRIPDRYRRDDDARRATRRRLRLAPRPPVRVCGKALGASILAPTYARYVIDLNRPPDGANLYPGQDTTGLLPVDTFDKEPLYRRRAFEPTRAEIARRRDATGSPITMRSRSELGGTEGEARQGAAVGGAFDPLARAAFFRGTSAGFQLRHGEWCERSVGAG